MSADKAMTRSAFRRLMASAKERAAASEQIRREARGGVVLAFWRGTVR
jgi:hypothetical protein